MFFLFYLILLIIVKKGFISCSNTILLKRRFLYLTYDIIIHTYIHHTDILNVCYQFSAKIQQWDSVAKMQNSALTHTVSTQIAMHAHADTEAFTKSSVFSQDHLIKQHLLYSMPGTTNKIKIRCFFTPEISTKGCYRH